MLADAIDEEELAEELFSSSLGEPEEVGIASKTSIGSLNRSYKDQDDPAQVMDRRKQKKSSEGNPGSDVSQHLELLTNAIVQQSLDSVKINVFQGEATDFARWLNDVKVRVECYTSCPKKTNEQNAGKSITQSSRKSFSIDCRRHIGSISSSERENA